MALWGGKHKNGSLYYGGKSILRGGSGHPVHGMCEYLNVMVLLKSRESHFKFRYEHDCLHVPEAHNTSRLDRASKQCYGFLGGGLNM